MQIRFQNIKFYVLVFILLTSSVALTESNKLEIEIDNPKFSEKGLDDKTYEIKAKKGLKSDVQLKLFTVEGKFKSDTDGRWIYMEADQGTYDQTLNQIELERNIKFYTNEGEIVKSSYATFDMENDIIDLKDNINHSIKEGLITSDNSVISNNFNNFKYEGNVATKFILKD